MKSFFAPLAVVAFVASTVSAQTFTINSLTNVVVCLPTLITWTGGTPPYFLVILPAGQPSAAALVDLGEQQGNSVTWLTNLGVGVSAFLNLRDNTGALAQSASFTVLAGGNSNTTCTTETVSQSQGTAVATSASSSPATTTGSTSGSSAVLTTSGTVKSTGTTTGTASTSTTTSAAISKYAGAGVVAVVGSALLALAL
ncbi:hypothetical protein HYPSUDRAFT_887602 [Hypholoma sublateritium FD-334 SS-4]|uniref:Uncharacterized protein n=1 Tax=Hypholoma sublateritium (strain FD-334 SS-4) TaxID=945553 RepID=A0A0D2NKQ7_HYPSF|nr:hypothetical protein HYPSUDRAFT_887602 [Hypholoma sublateritium FD-334 SS-4]